MGAVSSVSSIAQAIQLSVAPVFFLAAIGSILNVLAGRINRVVDRSRALERIHGETTDAELKRLVWELRLLDRRISIITLSILLCVASAVAICLVIIALFVAELIHVNAAKAVALAFIFALVSLVAGLVFFLIEIRIAVRGIHVRKELLG